jgi:hypothetical protein
MADSDAASVLLREISNRMQQLSGRAELAMAQLDDSHMWYRSNPGDNAIGNLVLHLVGNLRQWILGGLAGQPDTRDRDSEFKTTAALSAVRLTEMLRATVEECRKTIESFPVGRITEARRIQETDTTVAYALVMAVSHLGLHVGQIQFIAKAILKDSYKVAWIPPEKK